MSAGLIAGTGRALKRLSNVSREIQGSIAIGSLAYLGETMTNYAKDQGRPGAWKNQTGNLRASITWVVLGPNKSQAVPYRTKGQGWKTASVRNQTSMPMMVVFAGMDYAPYVEFKPGYNVLSGAFERYRPLAKQILGEHMKVTAPKHLKKWLV
jgi:hypothetical protein